jgi:hypothetical protein
VSGGTEVAVGGLGGVAVGEGVAQAEATNSDSRVAIRVILILIYYLLFPFVLV